jgi:hypothetical protein
MRKFYVVQKAGVPAIWETHPERLSTLLRRKAGYAVTSADPTETRHGAFILLRELFPGHRIPKARAARLQAE